MSASTKRRPRQVLRTALTSMTHATCALIVASACTSTAPSGPRAYDQRFDVHAVNVEPEAAPAAVRPSRSLDASSELDEFLRSADLTPLSAAEPEPTPHPFTGPWQSLTGSALLSAVNAPPEEEDPPPDHWSGLPLMSDLAREHDIRLPEPFGLSLNYSFINRPSRVTKVRAGVNGGDLTEFPSLAFDAKAQVQIALARLDAWVLPMLDVYLLGGYVWNQSDVDVLVDLPGAPNTRFTAQGDLEGPMYGGGVTLAGGYGNYFTVIDFNLTHVALGGLSEMDARLLTARVGYRVPNVSWADELRVYFATTYWDTARTIAGTVQTPGGGPISSIEYAVDQEPVDSLTLGGGVNVEFTKHTGMVLEMQGYRDTIYVVGGLSLRF